MTEGELRARIRELKLVDLLRLEVARSIQTTEEDARRYYQAHLREFRTPARARLQILLFRERERAEASRKELERGRKSFRDFQSYRLGRDPDAYYEVIAGQDPSLEPLAFSSPIGALRGPVRVGALWAVYRVAEVLPARAKPFSEVREQAIERAHSAQVRRAMEDLLKRLRRERGVRVYRTYSRGL